ncbi:MAG: hypothetical protein IJQ79_03110 [Bacteroidales bacterium]|nr:hypothetical protein [Bacteroidales bacterium]
MSTFERIEDAVKDYLDEYAKGDPVFAEKLANPNKSIEQCMEYIQSEIFHEFIKNGGGRRVAVACPSRQQCFGLAVHYYDEEKVEIRPMPGVTSVSHATPDVPLTEEDKEKAREKAIQKLADEDARKIKDEEEKKRQKAKEKRKKDEEAGVLFLFDE